MRIFFILAVYVLKCSCLRYTIKAYSMNTYQNYSMDDIIFENRNKAYGAFQLRQQTDRNTTYGLLLTASAFTVLVLLALFMPHHNSLKPPVIVEATPTDIFVEVPEPVLPKTVSPPKSITPPPPSMAFSTIETTTVSTPAEVTPPKQTDLASSTAAISTTTELNNNTLTASLNTSTSSSGSSSSIAAEIPVKPKIEKWVEVMPSFIGGNEALVKYLKKHIFMDSRDIEMGVGGKVIVQFYIDLDGSVRDAKVIRDNAGGKCAERALAAVNNMPKWNPGKQGDKAVRVYHILPITFQVN